MHKCWRRIERWKKASRDWHLRSPNVIESGSFGDIAPMNMRAASEVFFLQPARVFAVLSGYLHDRLMFENYTMISVHVG